MLSDLECCSLVNNELQKFLSRFESVNSHSQESIESAIETLENIQQELLSRAASEQQQDHSQSHSYDHVASAGFVSHNMFK